MTFSPEFSRGLHRAIREQAAAPWDQGEYDAALALLDRRYQPVDLVARAQARSLGGE